MKCLMCRGKMTKRIVEHRYVESGLKNVILKNIEMFICRECGEEEIGFPNLQQLHNLISNVIASQEQRLLPEEIRFLRSHLGFSGSDFAKAIGVTPETVSRWENGHEEMKISHERLLRILILYQFGPFRDYHKDLPHLGAKERKSNIRQVFKIVENRWKKAA